MSDLISREALKEALKEAHANFELTFDINTYGEVINIINNAPTIDISKEVWNKSNELLNKRLSYLERPQGEWKITEAYPHKVYCGECYKTYAQENWEVWKDGSLPRNFCPNCGADMRNGEEE